MKNKIVTMDNNFGTSVNLYKNMAKTFIRSNKLLLRGIIKKRAQNLAQTFEITMGNQMCVRDYKGRHGTCRIQIIAHKA